MTIIFTEVLPAREQRRTAYRLFRISGERFDLTPHIVQLRDATEASVETRASHVPGGCDEVVLRIDGGGAPPPLPMALRYEDVNYKYRREAPRALTLPQTLREALIRAYFMTPVANNGLVNVWDEHLNGRQFAFVIEE